MSLLAKANFCSQEWHKKLLKRLVIIYYLDLLPMHSFIAVANTQMRNLRAGYGERFVWTAFAHVNQLMPLMYDFYDVLLNTETFYCLMSLFVSFMKRGLKLLYVNSFHRNDNQDLWCRWTYQYHFQVHWSYQSCHHFKVKPSDTY